MIDKLGLDGLGGASVRVEPDRGLLGRIDDLQAELAASQAREQQLREALDICQAGMPGDKWDSLYIDGVLAFPQDDTALREWGAKLLRDLVYNRLEGLCNESGMKELLRKADELDGK